MDGFLGIVVGDEHDRHWCKRPLDDRLDFLHLDHAYLLPKHNSMSMKQRRNHVENASGHSAEINRQIWRT
jgi:hypothetical protein